MRLRPRLVSFLLLALLPSVASAAGAEEGQVVHHRIRAQIEPAAHRLEMVDEITNAPFEEGSVVFSLHAGLSVESLDSDLQLHAESEEEAETDSGENGGALAVRTWRVTKRGGGAVRADRTLRLRIAGEIHHPLESEGGEYARSFSSTSGIIGEEGVMLSGGSWWVPSFDDHLLSFEFTAELPEGWDAVSQGQRTEHTMVSREDRLHRLVTWDCPHPTEEVYLIAAPFHEFSRASGNIIAYAFLRSDDEALAAKYLEVTAQYIEMYRKLIGPYPFAKFALVENFWETGYGMPSFTLLGPTVIRLPFILHSSYPHEILHNWWGNGVYVDWASGNWCEGLTVYLADHLIKEGRGGGHDYRRTTLEGYRNYVGDAKDFPLTEFRSRHSSATQAVGYGKSMMLWHMLRVQLGDEMFTRSLQHFYRQFEFRVASFDDLCTAFTETTGEDLSPLFSQWVERTGAPNLCTEVVDAGDGAVDLILRQVQTEPAYELLVPVAVTQRDSADARMLQIVMTEKEKTVRIAGEPEVLRIDVDPEFDVFRRLHREEIPPTLSGVFGAEEVLVVVPAEGEDELRAAWLGFAEGWRGDLDGGMEIRNADEIEELPSDRSVWIVGSSNRWRASVESAIAERGVSAVPSSGDCFVYAVRHPADPDLTVGWIGSGNAAALPGLARKLPHYGKYSYLRFSGDEPTNIDKGQWSATASPMVWTASGAAVERAHLPEREALASLAPVFDPAKLLAHIEFLAAPEREGRGVGTEGLVAAEEYLVEAFTAAGLQPGGDGEGFRQVWMEPYGPDGEAVRLANIIGVLPGSNPDLEGESIVIGAHYDHLGFGWPDVHAGDEGKLHPGADDNASGIAVLIELAQNLTQGHTPQRTIVFVAFSGEEWGLKGSRHYVANPSLLPTTKIHSMVNLDTVGRLGDRPITIFGSGTASEWMHIAMGIGFTTGISSKCIADDPGGSDQVSFQEARIPAVQIFTGAWPDYHRPTDRIENIDRAGLVKITAFVKEMVVYLSERPEPLSANFPEGEAPKPPVAPAGGSSRRVSLGTVPDFAFRGPGVCVSSISPNSAAEEAGLEAGDILLAIDGEEIGDLRSYSELLKTHAPGDRVKLRIRRGEEELELEATLRAR
jgi:aminopeptidase N